MKKMNDAEKPAIVNFSKENNSSPTWKPKKAVTTAQKRSVDDFEDMAAVMIGGPNYCFDCC